MDPVALDIRPSGPFSLAASARFLGDFTPAGRPEAADGPLRLAFPADDGRTTVAALVRQDGTGPDGTRQDGTRPGGTGGHGVRQEAGGAAAHAVRAEFVTYADGPGDTGEGLATAGEVRDQIARILSLDVDGRGFPALAEGDRVVAGLMAEFPGLRPVCFHSPYEAAAWAIIGQRVRMAQAAVVKNRLAERHGRRVVVAGRTLYAFPVPAVLRTVTSFPGLTGTKIERLHALADAAGAGRLDAARLRGMPVDDALAELRALPGIGPFSAELILPRGAGHPDVFPRHERRLHAAMAEAYGLGEAGSDDVERLAGIAEGWKPYRSWVALLLRARAEHMVGIAPRA
ncbi:DNA-3-methyladenine glycosylase family protein [Streptomyces sp. DW26H14]|uniref:DNA-3-methyladenine glycosylase family protein n=1 Tax=Streptomyces sp. DW26H14 TaxID=3435395 RepID=UPI00403DCF6A